MRNRRKKIIKKRIITVLVALILLVALYIGYVWFSYERLPESQSLDTNLAGAYSYFSDNEAINTGRAYNFMTYNIGFGAYTTDYSFFMDGGKYFGAVSEEGLMANLCEITDVMNRMGADFMLLQEVDIDGTRTFHVNEIDMLNEFITGYYYNYAVNYNNTFVPYPWPHPYGANKSAIVTYSKGRISNAVRKSLPVPTDFSKLFDLDRCYSVTTIPTANEKKLLIYNVHLSAYTQNSGVKEAQLRKLFEDMEEQYKAGNYVVCGGDFNMNLKGDSEGDKDASWSKNFPRDMLPNGFALALDFAEPNCIVHNSCRNANEPYNKDTTFTVSVDGFIVSDNIKVNYYINGDWGYEYSDHDPVLMQVVLK